MLKTLVIIWVAVLWAYPLVMAARAAQQAGTLTLFWKVHLYPLAIVAIALDVAFNLTFGMMFLEAPRELLFSSRVERHFRKSSGWRLDLATFWARNLNVFDARHVTRRP